MITIQKTITGGNFTVEVLHGTSVGFMNFSWFNIGKMYYFQTNGLTFTDSVVGEITFEFPEKFLPRNNVENKSITILLNGNTTMAFLEYIIPDTFKISLSAIDGLTGAIINGTDTIMTTGSITRIYPFDMAFSL